MTARQDVEAPLDELRRRLYRSDATAADLDRYLTERDGEDLQEVIEVPPQRPAARPSRRLVLSGAVVLAAAGVAVVVGARAGVPRVALTPAAGPTPVEQDHAAAPVLAEAGEAEGPTPVAASVDGTAMVGQRFQGYGNAVVDVDPPQHPEHGGRASIAVTSVAPDRVGWRALLLDAHTTGTSSPVVLARGRGEELSGAHAPTAFTFPTGPPTRVVVEAPSGTGWTLVVAVVPADATTVR